MPADAALNIENERKSGGVLMPLIAAVALGAAGFGVTYMGIWTPPNPLAPHAGASAGNTHDAVTFVPLTPIELTLSGGRHRTLSLSATIETDKQAVARIEALMPRLMDSFNAFLAEVDPAAFDKRGVLEIIKYELTARTREALPDLPVNDLLITEFRLK